MIKRVIKSISLFFIIVLIGFGVIFLIFKYVNKTNQLQARIEQAKVVVLEQAKEYLGNEPNVVFEKIDRKNNFCWIGCVNAQNTHAIMYIARLNNHTEKWEVNVFSEREGANAISLFSIKHSVRQER